MKHERLKSTYDVMLEGENNQHFVTTKQYTVLVQTEHTTDTSLVNTWKSKKIKKYNKKGVKTRFTSREKYDVEQHQLGQDSKKVKGLMEQA